MQNALAAEVATQKVKVDLAGKIQRNSEMALSSPDFQKFTAFVHCKKENFTAQAIEVAKKFVRDVMCDQNLGPKDVAVVTLCDHSHHIGTLAIPFLVARAALQVMSCTLCECALSH